MNNYANFDIDSTIAEEERYEQTENIKTQQALTQMKECSKIENRGPPRIFGRTLVLCRYRNKALVTIGPDFVYTLCLIVSIILVSVGFCWLSLLVSHLLCYIGILISSCLLVSFLLTALISPGHPSFEIKNEYFKKVKEDRRYWCQICKLFSTDRSLHCPDCNCCVSEMDHHCVWVGKCIGKWNLHLFQSFITFGFIFFVYLFTSMIIVSLLIEDNK
ncbi:unnamed protein product [Moneuplotes crassus]|uniref:Palmitoyltransferase n=1 Tax=Euplotes crassus TaxID=5936 RepID=A0AAD2D5I3_EUPCR|nr:unnamed protein product [Moneuplotes crassus]